MKGWGYWKEEMGGLGRGRYKPQESIEKVSGARNSVVCAEIIKMYMLLEHQR